MLCKGESEPLTSLCKVIGAETDEYHQMDVYSQLLKQSINSILSTEEEKEVFSLFKSGGTKTWKDKFKGIEDFKLISFLIVR
jgi:hypothetical protein